MKTTLVFGIDPSSKKLATVYGVVGKENLIRYTIKKLPMDKPEACAIAYEWIKNLIENRIQQSIPVKNIYVFVELPVLGRGGAGSTIPQAQINGALLAGAYSTGVNVIPVNNSRVKKQVVGKGNAKKEEVKTWVREAWLKLYNKIGKDQDLCDSAMIWMYGKQVVKLKSKLGNNKELDAILVQRKTKITDLE